MNQTKVVMYSNTIYVIRRRGKKVSMRLVQKLTAISNKITIIKEALKTNRTPIINGKLSNTREK